MLRKQLIRFTASLTLGSLLLSSAVSPLMAQPKVTLKDGTVIVGTVSFADEKLAIDVDGSKLTFPLAEVSEVSSANVASEQQGQLLLFRGLEALAAGQGPDKALGLLTEAYRQAPEDPGVAYWFAWSLVRSGDGTAAAEVFRLQQKAISAAYPHMAKQLEKKIKTRLEFESLPRRLVERIDAISAGTANQPPNRDSESFAAYFRLIDQDERPIAKTDFRVSTSGDNESLEEFADGYFLYTFSRRRTYGASPVRLNISKSGLEIRQFEFTAVRNGIGNVGIFTVRRFGKQDLRELSFIVVDQDNNPFEDAQVLLRPVSNSGSSQNSSPQTTNQEGRAAFDLYPGKYSCSVTSAGFLTVSRSLSVPASDRPMSPVKLKLFPQVKATLKVEWRGTSMAPNNLGAAAGGQVTTGELSLSIGQSGRNHVESNWINLRQRGKKLYLYLQNYNYGYNRGVPGQQAPSFWIGTAKAEEGEDADSPEKLFKQIDLKKLETMKEGQKLEDVQNNADNRGNFELPLNGRLGTIFVGNCNFRDNRTGYPMQIQFKAWLEKIDE